MRKFGWSHLLWALAVGLAAGLALGLHIPRWGFLHPHRGGDRTAHMVDRFSRDLKLDAVQREKLTAILDKTHHRLMDLRKATGPKYEAIRRDTSREIEKILTPDQVKRFHELEKKREARCGPPGAGGMDPHGPPPGAHGR
jgi:Spy/CpxP family protein refolding chaperone